MPKLRRHRRDHRARAPKRRKRRNLVKFIPEADRDFAHTARNFITWIKTKPETYNVSVQDISDIEKSVDEFRKALTALLVARVGKGQSPQLRMRKDAARAKAEACVRTWANIIRADPRVPERNKILLRLKPKAKKLGKRKCPKTPPSLQFLGSGDGVTGGVGVGSGSGVHVIRFFDEEQGAKLVPSKVQFVPRMAKPDGAARVELFFDMIPAGEGGGVPNLPHERGWPKYLGSFSRSPMEVDFPNPSEPMLFVYWARWAGSANDVSRWSKPCVARVEGWTATPAAKSAQPEGAQRTLAAATRVETKYIYIQTPIAGELPDELEGDAAAEALARLSKRQMLPAA